MIPALTKPQVTMSDDEVLHKTGLLKVTDNGTNNNYGKWATEAYHKLNEWDLLKYIEGPLSDPPVIPLLREPATYHGSDPNGVLTSVRVTRNANKHKQATCDTEPWLEGNKSALNKIIAAVSGNKIHLVKHAKYAKQGWESLCSVY